MSYEKLKNFKKLFSKNKYDQDEEEFIITNFKYDKCKLPTIKKNAELDYIDKGSYAKVFKIEIGKIYVALRIAPYTPHTSDNNEIEYNIYKMLYDQFEKHNFVHIPILYDSYKCNYEDKYNETNIYLIKLLQFKSLINVIWRITLMEYTPLGNLNMFLMNKPKHKEYYTKIYLQILIILYFLNENIPGYYHNDLHLSNFLVRENKKKNLFYKFKEFEININDIDVIVLINDFDYSEYLSNHKKILNKKADYLPVFIESNFVDLFKVTNYFLYNFKHAISKDLYDVMTIVVPPELMNSSVYDNNGKLLVHYFNIFVDKKHLLTNKIYKKIPSVNDIINHKIFSNYLKNNF